MHESMIYNETVEETNRKQLNNRRLWESLHRFAPKL